MNWMAIIISLTWAAGWCCFLQSMFYGYISNNHPNEEVQGKAYRCQIMWAIGGVLTLTMAGWWLAGLAAR